MAGSRLTRKKVMDSLTTADLIDLLSSRVRDHLLEVGGNPMDPDEVVRYLRGIDLNRKISTKIIEELNDE